MEIKLKAKQHSSHNLWLLCVFVEIVRRTITQHSTGLIKDLYEKYHALKKRIEEHQKLIDACKGEKELLSAGINKFKSAHADSIRLIEKQILAMATQLPKESRSIDTINDIVEKLDTEKLKFDEAITPQNNKLSELSTKHNALLDEDKNLRSLFGVYSDFSGGTGSLKFILQKYLGFRDPHPLLHGGCNVLSPRNCCVHIESTKQPMIIVNMHRFFPHWDIRRLIYLCIFAEIVREDDYAEVKRDYTVGYAKELLSDVLNGQEIWVERGLSFKTEERDNDPILTLSCDKLNTWLSLPLPFEKLVSDPFFVWYWEMYSSRIIKFFKKKGAPQGIYKGEYSVFNQIYEFIKFDEEQLQKELLASPAT